MTEVSATKLYPRLLHSDAAELAESHVGLSLSELEGRAGAHHPRSIFTPTGGTRVSTGTLEELREGVKAIAVDAGYPAPFPEAPSHRSRLAFDFETARFLHDRMDIVPGEAGKDDVWAFLSCVLLPEFVRWRYPGTSRSNHRTSEERFLGGVRNTFQRLWWRAEVLVREDDEVLRQLNEDELVQIMERPLIASHRRVAQGIAARFIELIDRHPEVDRMNVMRDAQKRLRRLAPIVSFSALDDVRIDAMVREVLAKSAEAISDVQMNDWLARMEPESPAPPPERRLTKSLASELESEIQPPAPEILEVLAQAYPVRLDAREITAEVSSRQNPDSGVTKSDVNSSLYGELNPLLEKVGETPPQWRLEPSVVPDQDAARSAESSSDGAAFSEDDEAVPESDSGTLAAESEDYGPEPKGDRDILRVVLVQRAGELTPELVDGRRHLSRPTQYLEIISRLVELQAPFFRNGPRQLRPMTAQDLAADLDVHPSTVSRATSDVALAFRDQTIPATDLFSPGLPTSTGAEISAVAVRDIIRELILIERRRDQALTDTEIAERLNERGIEIARRTVAKYRQQLGIPGQLER